MDSRGNEDSDPVVWTVLLWAMNLLGLAVFLDSVTHNKVTRILEIFLVATFVSTIACALLVTLHQIRRAVERGTPAGRVVKALMQFLFQIRAIRCGVSLGLYMYFLFLLPAVLLIAPILFLSTAVQRRENTIDRAARRSAVSTGQRLGAVYARMISDYQHLWKRRKTWPES